MPSRFSYKNDSDEDQRASPEQTARDLHEQEQQAAYDRDFNALTSPENLAKDGVRQAEEKGDWDTNVTKDGGIDKSRLKVALGFVKKRGAIFGIAGLLGIGGLGAATFLGPAGMLVSLMENFTFSNDSSSTSLDRRFMKVFGNMTSGDPVCANSTKTIKCRMGRISNQALTQLSKKGVVPYFEDGTSGVTKKTGYPDKNPTGYTFDLGDGKKASVNVGDIPGYLANKENSKVAAKILGARGAFNLKLKAWSGKYITKKLFTKFGLERKGGLADGNNKNSKYSDVLAKLRKKIPGLDKLSGIGETVRAKVNGHIGSAKKGGAGYTLAVAGCIAVKAPGYIAAGVAAVQLAQIMPIVMDVVLSPGSRLKASGVDPASKFDSQDMALIGGLLTTQTARASDGKFTSALDSPYLQAAMGVNTNKLPVSTNYTPGFSILKSPIVISANEIDRSTAPACNSLMSPSAMYTAMAVDAAVTVAASATVIGGVVKVVAGFAISEIVAQVVTNVAGDAAVNAVTDFAKNDLIPQAEGEALGDVLGISATSFFASGGMTRNLPTVTTEQIPEFAALQRESQEAERDMDIATLSPFDTSSRYTFMGSIVYNLRMAAFGTGTYDSSVLSFISSAARLPLQSLSSLTGVASASHGYSTETCGYAADFGLDTAKDTANPQPTPAINMAGLPCTGITAEMAEMPTSSALSLLEGEGWIDSSKEISDGATVDDLVSSGFIKSDTPLADYINSCGDASTGDYLYNATSCTINTVPRSANDITTTLNNKSGSCGEDGCITSSADVGDATGSLKNGQSMTAIPVFLLDFQSAQMINGEDDDTGEPVNKAGTQIDQANVYVDSTGVECTEGTDDAGNDVGYRNGKAINIRLCSIPNTSDASHGNAPVKVNSRISGATLAMTKALAASIGQTNLRVADGFRTMKEQEEALAEYGPSRAAQPGYSNHQMGLAIDFQLDSNDGATRVGDPTYDWLAANAKSYGFGKVGNESWHWQALGADNSVAI